MATTGDATEWIGAGSRPRVVAAARVETCVRKPSGEGYFITVAQRVALPSPSVLVLPPCASDDGLHADAMLAGVTCASAPGTARSVERLGSDRLVGARPAGAETPPPQGRGRGRVSSLPFSPAGPLVPRRRVLRGLAQRTSLDTEASTDCDDDDYDDDGYPGDDACVGTTALRGAVGLPGAPPSLLVQARATTTTATTSTGTVDFTGGRTPSPAAAPLSRLTSPALIGGVLSSEGGGSSAAGRSPFRRFSSAGQEDTEAEESGELSGAASFPSPPASLAGVPPIQGLPVHGGIGTLSARSSPRQPAPGDASPSSPVRFGSDSRPVEEGGGRGVWHASGRTLRHVAAALSGGGGRRMLAPHATS